MLCTWQKKAWGFAVLGFWAKHLVFRDSGFRAECFQDLAFGDLGF